MISPNATTDEPVGESDAETKPATEPSLSIGHLMLWTTGIAVAASVKRFLAGQIEPEGETPQVLELISLSVTGLTLAVVGLYVGRMLLRLGPMPSAGGHWLAVGWGIGHIAAIAGQATWHFIRQGYANQTGVSATADQIVLGAVVFVQIAIRIGCWIGARRCAAWGIVFFFETLLFGALTANFVMGAGFQMGWWSIAPTWEWVRAIQLGSGIGGLLAIGIAAALHVARRSQEPSDWLHWTTVGALAIQHGTAIVAWGMG